MSGPIRILLQTTIEPSENDWHIGRFSLLKEYLEKANDDDGNPLFRVTARDRGPIGSPDPVISNLDQAGFDEMWLFAVDVDNGLDDADRAGIDRFHARGGGLMITRDHMDLGCSVCSITGVGAAHIFHTHNVDSTLPVRDPDDVGTPAILWPNFHSGFNGDAQTIVIEEPVHPILRDPTSPTGAIRYLPAHPHEGAVEAPAGAQAARVVATGRSRTTGASFNIAVTFEPSGSRGPALAESTFHHFADYNWDPSLGSPDFVSELPGDTLATTPGALDSVHRYVRNAALWLAGR